MQPLPFVYLSRCHLDGNYLKPVPATGMMKGPPYRLDAAIMTIPVNNLKTIYWTHKNTLLSSFTEWPYVLNDLPGSSINMTPLYGVLLVRMTVMWCSINPMTVMGTIYITGVNNWKDNELIGKIPMLIGESEGSGSVTFETGSRSTIITMTVSNNMADSPIHNFLPKLYIEVI